MNGLSTRGILLLILAFFLINTNSYSGWFQANSNSTEMIRAVSAVPNSNFVYASGPSGRLYKSTNLGQNWNMNNTGITSVSNSLHFISSSTGYLSTAGGQVYRTLDSGNTWAAMSVSPSSNVITKIRMFDANFGLFVGYTGNIYKTTNAGQNWTQKNSNTSFDLYDIEIIDANTAYAVGANSTILRTIDAGENWTRINSAVNGNIYGLAFRNANEGWVIGESSLIYHTTDAGISWMANTQISGNFNSIEYNRDKSKIFIVANDNKIFVSQNHNDWSEQYSSAVQIHILDVSFINDKVGFAVGQSGLILNTYDAGCPTCPAIDITSPIANSTYIYPTNLSINWTSSALNSNYVVEYSLSGANGPYTTIATTSATTINWSMPNQYNNIIYIKVKTSDNLHADTLGPITIDNKQLTLTNPNGNEIINTNTLKNIVWNAANISNVKIELSTDNGANWSTIANSVVASDLTYAWQLAANMPTSKNAKIRISDIANPSKFDISDTVFTIQAPELAFSSPSKDSIWAALQNRTITWSAKNVQNVKIEYERAYNSINLIAATVPASANQIMYNFPNLASTDSARIKFTQLENPNKIFYSEYFKLRSVPLILLSPNSNPSNNVLAWRKGTAHSIQWQAVDVNNVHILVSTNDGITWDTLAKNYDASIGNYNWNINHPTTNLAKIKLVNTQNPNMSITSMKFKIVDLKFLNPLNDSSSVYHSSPIQVKWNKFNTDTVNVEYSEDGILWSQIAYNYTKDTITWNSPVLLAGEERRNVQIRISSINDITVSDIRTIIVVQPNLNIIAPNNLSWWQANKTRRIVWTSSFLNKVKLLYSFNGVNYTLIKDSIDASSGWYNWTIPNTSPTNSITIKIQDVKFSNIFAISQPFHITDHKVVMVSPNGNEVFYKGVSRQIKWTAANSTCVDLHYTTNNGETWNEIASNIPASPSVYNWTPQNIPAESALFRVRDCNRPEIDDISDAASSIVALDLLYPNGGETFVYDQDYQIKWRAYKIQYVDIQFTTDNGSTWKDVIKKWPASLGFFNWKVPNNPSKKVKVKITDPDNTSFTDSSSAVFAINGLLLNSPAGGESYLVGDTVDIQWTSTDIENVKIEYSANLGQNWTTVISSTNGPANVYRWSDLPETPSSQCIIRISDVLDSITTNKNTIPFTIKGNGVVLKSPNGNEIVNQATSMNITWTAANIDFVDIAYSSDNGASWNKIIDNYAANARAYIWNVTNAQNPSREYLIRISDSKNKEIFDMSDSKFTVKGAYYTTPSNWNFSTMTGENSVVILPYSISPQISSRSFGTGDALGIFFVDKNGKEVCAGYSIWSNPTNLATYNLPVTVWGDNPFTPEQDGMSNEVYIVKVWDAQEGREILANATFLNNLNKYTNNGISYINALSTSKTLSITIPANSWNLISSNLVPFADSLNVMFTAINKDIVQVKNQAGLIYQPSLNLNQIKVWNMEQGYQIFTSKNTIFNILGIPAVPSKYTTAFSTGNWYFVSYLEQNVQSPTQYFSKINNQLLMIKDDAGRIYSPTYNIDQIQTLNPGKGYKLTVSSSTSFNPSSVNTDNSTPTNMIKRQEQVPSHFVVDVEATGYSSVIVLESKDLKEGDEIGVFSKEGKLYGSAVYTNAKAFVTIWGDNIFTYQTKEAFDEKEEMILKIWQKESNKELEFKIESISDVLSSKILSTPLLYNTDAMLHINGKLKTNTNSIILDLSNNEIEVSPNPFTNTVKVQLSNEISGNIDLEVINLLGQNVYNQKGILIDENNHTIELDLSRSPKGMYLLNINTGTKILSQKIIKN